MNIAQLNEVNDSSAVGKLYKKEQPYILFQLVAWLESEKRAYVMKGDETESFMDAGFLYARASQIDKVLAKIKMLEAGM
jgi:hypothetical protein